MTSPYGVTIFCDDIREEQDGKRIIIGAYDDGMLVPELPSIIPSIGFLIKIFEPIEYRERLGILKIYAPKDGGYEEILIHEMDQSRWSVLENPNFDPEAKFVGSNYIIRASPFKLNEAGYIRVRAYYGDEEIKLGSIHVSNGDL